MSKRKSGILTAYQLQDLIDNDLAEDECSPDEDDYVEESTHDTDSEQECNDPDFDTVDLVSSSTEGNSSSHLSQTPAENIIRFKCGPNIDVKDSEHLERLFDKFISEGMLRYIVYYTNKEIAIRRQQYNKEVSYIYET